MAQFVVANNVNTQLAAALPASGAGSTTVTLASSANLPTLNTAIGQMMPLTLNDAATGAVYETVYVTAISGPTLTVLRAQEGTGALNWSVGDFAFCGPTAGTSGLTTMRTQYQASASYNSSQTLTAAIAGESVGFTGSSAATFSLPGQSTVPALTPTSVYNDGTAALTLTAAGSDKFVVASGQFTSVVMQPGDDLSFYASATPGLWQAASGAALRQFEPLVVAPATQSNQAPQLGQMTGRLLNIQTFNSSGTYTPTAGTTHCRVTVVGGGASGGGAAATSSGQVAFAGGGGGGGSSGGYYPVATLSGHAVTVGAGGLGSAINGNNGGTSSVGATLSGSGGIGGSIATSSAPPAMSAGGAGGGGTGGNLFNSGGFPGTPGFGIAISNAAAGNGGGTILTGGVIGPFIGPAPGNPGLGPGSGSSGACSQAGGVAESSQAALAGIVLIEEYA